MAQFDASSSRRRGWVRLWSWPIFIVGVFSLAVVAGTTRLRENPGRELRYELRQLRQALKEDRELPEAYLDNLLDKAAKSPRTLAECEFLVGSYDFQRGNLDPKTTEWFQRAEQHLARALTFNAPDGDLPALLYRLGMARYRLGQQPSQALNMIGQGLDLGAENPAKGYAFLAEGYSKLPEPNLNAALSASQRHLQYADDRNPEAMARARYLHADILNRLERRPEALRELELIDEKIPAPLLAKVRLLQAICCESEGAWPEAIAAWKSLEPLADEIPGGRARILYSLGVATSHVEPIDEAQLESLWKQGAAFPGEEGQASAVRLGHLLLLGGRYEPDRAIELLTDALNGIRVAGDYKNSYLPLATVVELFDQGLDRMLERNDHARTQTLAALMSRITPPGTSEERRAQSCFRWAKELADRAEKTPAEAESLLREARRRYQDAGDYFKQASLTREGEAKVDLDWQSAFCYLSSQDYANAARALESFITLTKGDPRNSQGHFALADAYFAQNQRGKARAHYLKCIELNAPPYVFRALAKLAQIEIDARKLDSARDILQQIVSRNGPDLERGIYEQALYSLGKILFDLGEPEEGAIRLREASRQFKNNPAAWAVRDKLATYSWERAKQISVAELQAVAPERRQYAESMLQKRRQYLTEAHDEFRSLARDLEERFHQDQKATTGKLGPLEFILHRNAQFNVGHLKIELGEFSEALDYARSLQVRYKGRSESLYAASQVHSCWKQLARSGDRPQIHQIAGEAIRNALRDLDEIPRDRDDEVFLSGPQPFSRDQWRQFLRTWEGELQHISLRTNPREFGVSK